MKCPSLHKSHVFNDYPMGVGGEVGGQVPSIFFVYELHEMCRYGQKNHVSSLSFLLRGSGRGSRSQLVKNAFTMS